MTDPVHELRAAGFRTQAIADRDPTDQFSQLLSNWLYRVAHGWQSLQAAAEQVLDPANPDHVEPARLLNEGPYDAKEALALARLINTMESSDV